LHVSGLPQRIVLDIDFDSGLEGIHVSRLQSKEPIVAARLAGGGGFAIAATGKPDCYR
jgi:hypothetical protein